MPDRQSLCGRERVARALRHECTDRIPIGMVCAGINPPARKALGDFLAARRGISVEEYLDPIVDIVEVSPVYTGPSLPRRTDIWGVGRRDVSYGSGSYDEIVHYPLAADGGVPDLDAHRWPDPDWFDYAGLPRVIDAALRGRDMCVMVGNGNIFETSWYMRGFEQMLMDVMTDEDLVNRIMERVTAFYCAFFSRVLEAARGRVDLIFTADDIGDQRGLLMPLEKWERLIKPHHARLNAVVHACGAKVIYHTDGSIMPAVEGLIDMGIDVLQALQFSADNMDPEVLKDRFGDRLCFEGGVSVQTTLPFGSPEDVRREVQERIRVLGRDGGYILGPAHWIQAGTPAANIAALFDTALEYYPFCG
ncbi:MAG TPA: uroporphyrinogen decarboxylase family protein [Spirochaetia bacterium]|nr:uroporphyrinogen decarboxylase family protein [Spirochaetia bacterium]